MTAVKTPKKKIAPPVAEPVPALPPVGTLVLVQPTAEGEDMGPAFRATVTAHLTPEQQAESAIDDAVLIVTPTGEGSEPEHVRLDEVTVLEEEAAPALPVPVIEQRSAPRLQAGTLGIHEVPLSQLTRSGCNVRSHYDAAATAELAESLASQGQLENCTGRWTPDGLIEIVAGETRRRAWLHLQEQGRAGEDQPVLVHVREMTDAEALAVSATENMRRRNMTALEECEAMQRLQDAGRTLEDLAAMFGYKSVQPVADRILVARNLLTDAREALDAGKISLAQAFVIARAPGQNLQNQMVDEARYHSASKLAQILTQGQFLVKTAAFNVQKSGLEVVTDLFDTFEPYFKNKAKALEAQIAHANMLAERRRAKGDRAFVAVETGESGFFSVYSSKVYEYASQNAADAGTVLYVCTSTGVLLEEKGVRLQKKAGVKITESGKLEKGGPERKMPDSAYLEAHTLRAKAAREAVLGQTHLTLALTVQGLILGSNTDVGRVATGQCAGMSLPEQVPAPLRDRHAALQELLLPITDTKHAKDVYLNHVTSGVRPNPTKLLDLLLAMTDEDLLQHLNTLIAPIAYNWSLYSSTNAPADDYVRVAELADANAILARDFKLTQEWLKRYPRGDLVKLAEEAGLGRALVEDCKTLKDMRGRILEHADRLHREGFVPKFVKFKAAKR